jgi:hypothetical protein
MKKNPIGLNAIAALAVLAVTLLFTALGCASAKTAAANVAVDPIRVQVLGWKNQNLGEPQAPAWLKMAVKGNFQQLKQDYAGSVGASDVVKLATFQHENLNMATTIADVQFFANVARELKANVLAKAAVSMQAGEFEAVNDAAVRAQVNVVGMRRVTDFWQQVRTSNAETGEMRTMFIVYVVYATPEARWNDMYSYYMRDVFGVIPESAGKQAMRGLFDEINADIKRDKDKSDLQFLAELAAQQQALENQAVVNSQARMAALKSGDPVQAAAATTHPSDGPAVNAQATAAKILF